MHIQPTPHFLAANIQDSAALFKALRNELFRIKTGEHNFFLRQNNINT